MMAFSEGFEDIDLPQHLTERVRIIKSAPVNRQGEFVLYWMHHAVRSHENPALDVAVALADQLKIPVLVYQGLGGRHPYNSDRHHTFIMEGARDIQKRFQEKGIRYVFYLAERPQSTAPLRRLADRAAITITEDFPAPPFPGWMQQLARKSVSALWAVDCACIIPMQSIPKSYSRAYQFRRQTLQEYKWRVPLDWITIKSNIPFFDGDPGFNPIDFNSADIAELCARCEIDHSIGPVAHTPGGSEAGYDRWEAFKARGLKQYARQRNDAAVLFPRGVSRISAYLHHGHVSPFRVAREAALERHAGAEKYLDELLIWRELAHNFCFHNRNPESLDVLPEWARQTLRAHADDPRPAIYYREKLSRGDTGDDLWDAAQQSLLVHGELHNNVRMTWGKALLQWTRSPENALRMMIDLNHRYALDGNDPNSYGGLLWCLGLFDRPFKPEKPVIGSLRPRPTAEHAKRLDMGKYRQKVCGPVSGRPLSIAVIGAGLSGLTAARILKDHGHDVRVYEKSRGAGGRMATRREGELRFDHGAQYFTVRDDRFHNYLESWQDEGLVEEWKGAIASISRPGAIKILSPTVRRYVGVPGMNTVARHLAEAVRPVYRTQVRSVDYRGGQWQLTGNDDSVIDRCKILIVTAPAEQAAMLLSDQTDLLPRLQSVRMRPCWAVMAAFEKSLGTAFDGAFFNNAPISWAARNNSKPGRTQTESWIIHAENQWSITHANKSADTVAESLTDAFFEYIGSDSNKPIFLKAHFWRYAIAENPLKEGFLWDPVTKVGVCGDWCMLSRVEGAFLSGMAIAGRILGMVGQTDRQMSLNFS